MICWPPVIYLFWCLCKSSKSVENACWWKLYVLQISVAILHFKMVKIILKEQRGKQTQWERWNTSRHLEDKQQKVWVTPLRRRFICTPEGQSHNWFSRRKNSHPPSFPKVHDTTDVPLIWAHTNPKSREILRLMQPVEGTSGDNTPSHHYIHPRNY